MSVIQSARAHALAAQAALASRTASAKTTGSSIWHWVNSVLQGVGHLITGPLSALAKIGAFWIHTETTFTRLQVSAFRKLVVWFYHKWIKSLMEYINRRFAQTGAVIRKNKRELLAAIVYALRAAIAYTVRKVAIERTWRIRGDKWLFSQIKTRIRWLHQNIEREAVSGYALGQRDRAGVITELAGLLATYAPETRFLVRQLVRGILDLLVADDPVLRITLGFVMRHIIRKLALDKPVGDLLGRLVGSILAGGKPKGLHDVTADISQRLAALEGQWATFMADGGAEILQAGTEWQSITALGTNAALLAFCGLMAAAPERWSHDMSATAGVALNDTIGAVAHLIRKAG